MKILCAWIGDQDLIAAELMATKKDRPRGNSPIFQAAENISFDRMHLLYNPQKNRPSGERGEDTYRKYTEWLTIKVAAKVTARKAFLTSPTMHEEIWQAVQSNIKDILKNFPNAELYFHLTSGTPSMHAIWLLVGRSLFPAKFIQTSEERGFEIANIPFDIAVEHIAEYYKKADQAVERLSSGHAPVSAKFGDIIYRSPQMVKAVEFAKKVALRNIKVLIEGESGTGKELLALAIHNESPRSTKPFIAINCGAIPENLLESELFGYERGAFTGAVSQKKGQIEQADKGTLFLDEIGELPLIMQVKLLRFLEKQEFMRVGGTQVISVNTRIISATNRNLISEIHTGKFREDLFYRIAEEIIYLPPLRDREGDFTLLIDYFLKEINNEFGVSDPGYIQKKLKVEAKKDLMKHHWPGNCRELRNTMTRIINRASDNEITVDNVKESLLMTKPSGNDNILDKQIGEGFKIEHVLGDVARHYLKMAWDKSGGNKSKAARLLGLGSHNVFSQWMERYAE